MTEYVASARNIVTTLLVSLLVAGVGLLIFVLPAEYDFDPTGLGQLLGVKGMAGYSVSALTLEEEASLKDEIEFTLGPFESIEYKYPLEQGQAIVYTWQATGEVVFDLHSEEVGTDPEEAVSFSVGRGLEEHGTYVAPYDGIHGWFWENRGDEQVDVTLTTSGYFRSSKTYSSAGEYERQF